MFKMKLGDILRSTDAIFPTDADFDKEVNIAENGGECDGDTLLFITPRANGERRNAEIHGIPYAIVCEEADARRFPNERLIITEDARRSLSFAYYNLYGVGKNHTKYIAVTGTNGKTSVAEMIHYILCFTGADVGYIGTGSIRINDTQISDKYYSMTTPDPELLYRSIREMEQFGCEYIVLEASSHGIAQGRLAPLWFEVGIFTNLSAEHRDFHPTMQDYFEVKLSLFESCRVGIFNLDCPYSARASQLAKCKAESVGIINRGQVFATDIEWRDMRGSSFYYREDGLIFSVDLSLAGAFNVYNCLMALRCAIDLGIKPCEAKRAINCLTGIDGRMERISEDINVIIDYAHTPLAVENVLKTLFLAKRARQNILLVIGCGGEREREKRSEIGRIAEKYAHRIYLTEDNSRGESTEEIIADILSGIRDPDAATVIPSRKEAIERAILDAERGDTVAILGKGREGYLISKDGYSDFSDKAEAISALRVRRAKNENKA